MIIKQCTICKECKDETNFNKHKLGKHGLNPVCRACRTERQRVHRAQNGYGSRLKAKYGITWQDYLNMIEQQLGKCYICGTPFDLENHSGYSPCVDHDHKTGKVRKIICRYCNVALGQVKDDPMILENMILYLKEH